MRSTHWRAESATVGLAALVGLLMLAAPALAGGSGYNLSYTAAANSNIIPAVDLVSVSTSYSSGPNLTADLTVAGTPITDNSSYSYVWLFGGGATGNSTAWAFVENNSAYLHSIDLGLPVGINYTVAGSTLSISVATDLVGSAPGFTFNGEASRGDSSDPSTYSFLGTNYDGSGTCTGSSCNSGGTGPGSGNSPAPFPIGAIIWPVVIVVIIVVVLLVRRRRPPTPSVSAPPPPPSTPGTWSPPPPPPPGQ
jgi:hypothetical protein